MSPKDYSTEEAHNAGGEDTTHQAYKDKLGKRMKVTKSNRFNCAKRLERKAQNQSLVLNFLSLLTVLSGIYLLAFSSSLTISGAQFVGVFSICVSVLAITISQQGAAQEMSKRATDAHRCGREVSHLYRQLEAGTLEPTKASEEYEKVISSYEDNHDPCDFMSTLWNHKKEMKGELEEKGATWWNSIFLSYYSASSPVLYAFLGLVMIISVCLSTPAINKYFHDIDSSSATLGAHDQIAEDVENSSLSPTLEGELSD